MGSWEAGGVCNDVAAVVVAGAAVMVDVEGWWLSRPPWAPTDPFASVVLLGGRASTMSGPVARALGSEDAVGAGMNCGLPPPGGLVVS